MEPLYVTKYLRSGVTIGCETEAIIENIRSALPDTLVRALRVDCAYHSRKCVDVRVELMTNQVYRSYGGN